MDIVLNECTAARPDRRAIGKMLEEIADGMDPSLASELADVLVEGSSVDISVSSNTSSALRALRKLDIDYAIVE